MGVGARHSNSLGSHEALWLANQPASGCCNDVKNKSELVTDNQRFAYLRSQENLPWMSTPQRYDNMSSRANQPVERMAAGGRHSPFRMQWAARIAQFCR